MRGLEKNLKRVIFLLWLVIFVLLGKNNCWAEYKDFYFSPDPYSVSVSMPWDETYDFQHKFIHTAVEKFQRNSLEGIQFCVDNFLEISSMGDDFIEKLSRAINDIPEVQEYILQEIKSLNISLPQGKDFLSFLSLLEDLSEVITDKLAKKIDIAKIDKELSCFLEVLLKQDISDESENRVGKVFEEMVNKILLKENEKYFHLKPFYFFKFEKYIRERIEYDQDFDGDNLSADDKFHISRRVGSLAGGDFFDMRVAENNLARQIAYSFLSFCGLGDNFFLYMKKNYVSVLFAYLTAAAYSNDVIANDLLYDETFSKWMDMDGEIIRVMVEQQIGSIKQAILKKAGEVNWDKIQAIAFSGLKEGKDVEGIVSDIYKSYGFLCGIQPINVKTSVKGGIMRQLFYKIVCWIDEKIDRIKYEIYLPKEE